MNPWSTDKFYQYLVDKTLDLIMRSFLLIRSRQLLVLRVDNQEYFTNLDYALFGFHS